MCFDCWDMIDNKKLKFCLVYESNSFVFIFYIYVFIDMYVSFLKRECLGNNNEHVLRVIKISSKKLLYFLSSISFFV